MVREVRLIGWCAAALIAIAPLVAAQDSAAFPPATPESQGMSAPALAELADAVRGFVKNEVAIGAELLVIKNRHTVFHEGFGWSDREEEEPYAIDTVCNIRSMTKPLTGAAAQILIDRGVLSLDDTVAKYVPAFDTEKARGVTIRQLLTHRSGLPLSVVITGGEYESLFELASEAGERGPYFAPEEKFWYSDAGSDTLGAVVEVASGRLLDEFVRAELLDPLGMGSSFWLHEEDRSPAPRMASLYARLPGGWVRFWSPGRPFIYEYAWGSQSLYSTPADYAKFLAMWMDEGRVGEIRILSEDAIARTLTPVSRMTSLGSDDLFPCGLDDLLPHYGQMSVLHIDPDADDDARPVIIGHSGSDGTIGWAWPERDLMVLYFTQSRGGASALLLEPYIDYLLLHPERQEESYAHFEPYVGTYTATGEGGVGETFAILVQNGHLALHMEGRDFPYELRDADEHGRRAFLLDDRVAVSFPPAAKDELPILVLHEPDGEEPVFHRVVE